MTYRAIYPITDALVDWASHNLLQVQQSTFFYYRQIFDLVRVVADAEDGVIPKFAALSAIRNYNDENGTNFSYDEIRMLDSSFVFSDVAEWVVFTDNPEAIICGAHDDPEEALTNASEDVKLILVWDVESSNLVVYRSPYVAQREYLSGIFTHGEHKGDADCYVLPPEVEASLHAIKRGELIKPKPYDMRQEYR